MSQNDLTIANQGFASFRSDLNSALQALGSTNSGTSAPSTTFANQLFYDTTNNILKIRNEDNDAFISLFTLDQANDNIESLTIDGALTAVGALSAKGGVVFNEDSADVDFRVESNGLTNAFVVDGGNNGTGFGHTPRSDLHTAWTQSFFGREGSLISQLTAGVGIDGMSITQNAYIDSDTGGYAYMTTNEATKIDLADGVTKFSRASSGTAGNAISFSESLRIDTSGRVMIGTTTEGEPDGDDLTIATTGNTGMTIRSGTSSTGSILFSDGTSGDDEFRGFIQYLHSSNDLRFATNSAERLRINNDGNVLIGRTSELNDFGDGRTSLVLQGSGSQDYSTIQLGNNGTASNNQILGLVGFFDGTNENARVQGIRGDGTDVGDLQFFTRKSSGSLTERMRIYRDGNVGIGTQEPTAILHLLTASEAHVLKVRHTENADKNLVTFQHAFAQSSQTATMIQFRDSGGSERGSIKTSGSATSFNTSSDYRLKENVDYTFDATSRLKQLKPARFNFISDTDNTVDGFLAHEVSSIVPEAITGEKDAMTKEVLYVDGDEIPDDKKVGDVKEASKIAPQGIDQSKLVPLLVKTIQELEARITALEGA